MDKTYPTTSAPKNDEVKTIMLNFILLVAVVAIAFFSFGWKKDAPSLASIMPTSVLQSLPTRTAFPTSTATSQPSPTATRTALPTAVPPTAVPTVDPDYIRELNMVNAEARDVKNAQDAAALEIAWGWVKLAGVVLLMLIGVVAAITAYARSLRGDYRKPVQNGANQAVQATQQQNEAQAENIPPSAKEYAYAAPDEWLDLVNWTTGKMPQETKDITDLFGGQANYRRWRRILSDEQYLQQDTKLAWYVTQKFGDVVGRKIG